MHSYEKPAINGQIKCAQLQVCTLLILPVDVDESVETKNIRLPTKQSQISLPNRRVNKKLVEIKAVKAKIRRNLYPRKCFNDKARVC